MLLEPEGDKQVRTPDFLAKNYRLLIRKGGINATETSSVHTQLSESKLGLVA
jgi:hypothetical protein